MDENFIKHLIVLKISCPWELTSPGKRKLNVNLKQVPYRIKKVPWWEIKSYPFIILKIQENCHWNVIE